VLFLDLKVFHWLEYSMKTENCSHSLSFTKNELKKNHSEAKKILVLRNKKEFRKHFVIFRSQINLGFHAIRKNSESIL